MPCLTPVPHHHNGTRTGPVNMPPECLPRSHLASAPVPTTARIHVLLETATYSHIDRMHALCTCSGGRGWACAFTAGMVRPACCRIGPSVRPRSAPEARECCESQAPRAYGHSARAEHRSARPKSDSVDRPGGWAPAHAHGRRAWAHTQRACVDCPGVQAVCQCDGNRSVTNAWISEGSGQ